MQIETLEVFIKKTFCDKYGHVNYKKYLDLFSLGQNDYAKKREISFSKIHKEYGLQSVIRQMNIEYIGQIFPHETIVIQTSISRVGKSSFTYSQEIVKDGVVKTRFQQTVVMINSEGKATKIPSHARIRLIES